MGISVVQKLKLNDLQAIFEVVDENTLQSLATSTPIYWAASSFDFVNYSDPDGLSGKLVKDFDKFLQGETGTVYPTYSGILSSYNTTAILITSNDYTNISMSLCSPLSGEYFKLRNNLTTDKAILTGTVIDYTSNEYSFSGTLDINTRAYTIDFNTIPPTGIYSQDNILLPVTGVNILASYWVSYGNYVWGTEGYALTTEKIELTSDDYLNVYSISAFANTVSSDNTLFTSEFISISVLELQPDYVSVQAIRSTGQPYDATDGLLQWVVSDPISATFTRIASTVYITTDFTLPAHSGDNVLFTTDTLIPNVYTISALNVETTIVPATYDFNYDPAQSESLAISLLSSNDTSALLWLQRVVEGTSGTVYTAHYPIRKMVAWQLDPDYITGTTTVSGFSGENLQFPYDINIINTQNYKGLYTLGTAGSAGIIQSDGINNVVGLDVIKLIVDPLSAVTYNVSGYYYDNSALATYIFTPSYPTTNISISALSENIQTQVKSYTLKGVNEYLSQYTNINPSDLLAWNFEIDNISNISLVGYVLGEFGLACGIDTISFTTTANSSITPALCTFTTFMSAISSPYTAQSGLLVTQQDFQFYEFLDDSVFDVQFRINYEDPRDVNNQMWRLTSVTPYTITAVDISYIPNVAVNYNRLWDFGDGTTATVTTSSTTHTYSLVNSLTTYTITLTTENVSGIYTKPAEEYMNLIFVERFLSGSFIAWPTIVFPNSAEMIFGATSTQSQGVCAYGEGHTETFNLSANEPSQISFGGSDRNTTYIWRYGQNTKQTASRVTTIDVQSELPTTENYAGTSIQLDVFNDVFPTTMVSAHTADNGMLEVYPNFAYYPNTYSYTTSADDSNILFQNMRFSPYESPSASIVSYDSIIIVQQDSVLNAQELLQLPDYSPVTIQARSCTWQVSTNNWTDYYGVCSTESNSAPLVYSLQEGDGYTVGTLNQTDATIIDLKLTGVAVEKIEFGTDWQNSGKVFQTTLINQITAYVLPVIKVYTTDRYAVTGEQVKFENITSQLPNGLISGFIWSNGNGTLSALYDSEAFNDFYCTYQDEGTYSLYISAIAFNGYVYPVEYINIITVINGYTEFDDSVYRIYGSVTLEMPNSEQTVLIPPNEWVTADNINSCFDALNSNIDYLDGVTKLYSPPPNYYYGWLGSLTGENDSWHVDIDNINSGLYDYNSAQTKSLSSINSLVVKNDKLYMANNNRIQIYDNTYQPTLISEKTEKAIGDSFVTISSIAVGDDDRIYVVDSPKNRIVVFEYDEVNDIWTLLYGWGGFGGLTAKTKFQTPTDVVIYNNYVWVVDSLNLCIKQYSKSGGWIQTITSDLFTTQNIPISITFDSDDNLHVLTQNYVVKLSQTGTFISSYTYSGSGNAKKIISGEDGGFVYICTTSNIVKVTEDGVLAGIFGVNTNNSYLSIASDENRNLYISNTNSIIKYNDKITIIDIKMPSSRYVWDMSDIYIDEDEYVQDWVYNKSFSRMWDNIELFRRSIKGKVVVSEDTLTGIQTLTLKGFTLPEYVEINDVTNKEDIYVGVNEFVTADVINRCLQKLLDIQRSILSSID